MKHETIKQAIADEYGIDPADVEIVHVREKREPCNHEFTQTGDPDSDYCVKCGCSFWYMAFMECP